VHLAVGHREGHAPQDLGAVDGDVEVVDLEEGPQCNNTTPVVEIRARLRPRK
jgi:hypothetical protein